MVDRIMIDSQTEMYPGDLLQVKDRERKAYTLKYEGHKGKYAVLKQTGRNTIKIFEVETSMVPVFMATTYRKFERVYK